jgi:hypothetical protein
MVGPNILYYRCKITNKCDKKLVGFINVSQIYSQHVSASGCHLQGVAGDL